MSEQNAENTMTQTLTPLQIEGRQRELAVETQIRTLQNLTEAEFWRRVRLTDHGHPDFIQEETLVYLLRDRFRKGEARRAGDIAEILVDRTANFLRKQVAAWKSLTPPHVEDCIAEIYSQMWLDLFNMASSSEFWEIRFWLCLRRRALNIIQRYRQMDTFEYHPSANANENERDDPLESVAAVEKLSAHHRVEIREALGLLPDRERTVFVLYHYEDWTQQEIASRLKITDRTVRNALERAEKRLQGWRTG